MSDNQQNQKKSILQQITNEMNEAKRKSVKTKVKGLVEELQKANEVRDGIFDKIVEELSTIGEDTEALKDILGD